MLSLLFLAIFALYLNVRPDVTPTDTTPAGGGSDVQVPANPLVPTAPTTTEPTEEPGPDDGARGDRGRLGGHRDADDGQHDELPGQRDDRADDRADDRVEHPDRDLGADVPDRRDDRTEHLLAVPDRVTVTEAVPPSHDAATHRRARSSLLSRPKESPPVPARTLTRRAASSRRRRHHRRADPHRLR